MIEENELVARGNSNKNNNKEHDLNCIRHELFVERLCHPVVNLSYTVQPDMVTVLLRKKADKTWESLQKQSESLIQTAAQVYI